MMLLGKRSLKKKILAEGHLHLPDREAELPGPLLIGGEGDKVVEADDLLPFAEPFQQVVLAGVVGPAVEGEVSLLAGISWPVRTGSIRRGGRAGN